jgi:hypothetical protein
MIQIDRHLSVVTILLGVLLVPAATRAQGSPAAGEQTPAVEAQSATLPPPPPAELLPSAAPTPTQPDKPAGLDFEFFGAENASGADTNSTEKIANASALSQKRRHRLETHQLLGLTTWAFMAASCIIGQLNYHDLYGGGSGRGSYMMPHRLLVYSTAGLFTATGIYALLAPQPYKKPLKFDTGLIHRIAAIGATAGMVAEVVLGFITARTADSGNSSGIKQMATVHDVVGWTTFGFMTAAGAAWIF